MNAKHTPGPWIVETDDTAINALVYGKGRKRGQRKQLVAQVWSGDDCTMDVVIANARLIAAAPETAAERDRLKSINAELVAALERCLAHFERIRDQQVNTADSPIMAQVRAALAKAKGE